RRDELTRQLAEGEAPLEALAASLEQALQQRVQVEQELHDARVALESAEARMRTLDEQRMQAEKAVEEARAGLEDVRMLAQELKVRKETLLEQFRATQFDLATVYQELPQDAEIAT